MCPSKTLWTLKYEFYIIFTCHEILLFQFIFNHLKMFKLFLIGCWIWPVGHNLLVALEILLCYSFL